MENAHSTGTKRHHYLMRLSMASSTSQPMEQTVDAYRKLAQRDLELIEEQQQEIGVLRAKVNNLQQKLKKRTRT